MEASVALGQDCIVESSYRLYYVPLLRLAQAKFHVAPEDAQQIVQDAFTSFVARCDDVEKPREWLIAAVCNGARYHIRSRRKTIDVDAASLAVSTENDLLASIRAEQAVSLLSPSCKETLRLHYVLGHSAREIASLAGTTDGYAEKTIHKCLQRARKIFSRLEAQ